MAQQLNRQKTGTPVQNKPIFARFKPAEEEGISTSSISTNQNWSRERIIETLISMHRSRIPLTANSISQRNSGLHNAIYYHRNGIPKYFGTLAKAREAAAQKLGNEGDLKSAQEIRRYELPRPSPMKFSEQRREERKTELIGILKGKIARNERVSYRHQQKIDRPFVGKVTHAFGKYRNLFTAAGIPYQEHARHVKKGRRQYLEDLIRIVCLGQSLDRKSMEGRHRKLVERLNHFYGGHYGALEAAAKELRSRGLPKEAQRADPEYWKTKRRNERRQKAKQKKEEMRGKIAEILLEKTYRPGEMPFMEFKGEKTGKEIMGMMKGSKEWIETSRMAELMNCTSSNLIRVISCKSPEKIIRFTNKGRIEQYLFHVSIGTVHERKNRYPNTRERSPNQVARMLGIGEAKVRRIVDQLGLDHTYGNRYRSISPQSIGIIRELIKREKGILDRIVKGLDPEAIYTMSELEMMGIPVSNFLNRIRKGTMQAETKDGARAISGKSALEYFNGEYKEIRGNTISSDRLLMLSFFNPRLYTTTDLIQILGKERSTVRCRLMKLSRENPESCFSIIRGDNRTMRVVTEDAIPILRNWASRAEVMLINVLKDDLLPIPKQKDVMAAIRESKGIEISTFRREDTAKALGLARTLRSYESERVEMDSMAIRNSALALVFQYMKTHSCKSLELSRQYSLAEVESMVHDPLMFESAERERVKLEFSVYRANMGLVHHLIRKMGLDEAELLMHGQDALMDAIRKYDPEKGKFGAFAGAVIRNRLIALARRANRQVSLDREVGEGVPLMGLMGTADAGHEEYELKEIAKKALQALTPREREIIGARVGLDGNGPKTLEETGRIFNITREWARQIESRAKEKMRIRLKKDKILSF